MNGLLLGSQTPTLFYRQPGELDYRLGDLAVQWAGEVAGYELYPWQRMSVREILARRLDGLWAARDVVLEVPRQQGKNLVLEVVELFLVFVLGCRLLVHSAHRDDTVEEHFIRLRDKIEEIDDLASLMPVGRSDGIYSSAGRRGFWLDKEQTAGVQRRILFKARQSNAGRGPSPQVLVLDEAFDCSPAAIGSLAPSLTAQPNPLLIFASSAPKATSVMLHDFAARAVEADPDDRLLYIGWRSPSDVDPESDEALARVSPSLGLGRVTIENIRANKRLLRKMPGEYEREHLGVAEMPVDDGDGPIPLDVWNSLAQVSTIESHLAWALAVSPDRQWCSIGVAGRRADGRLHVEVIERRSLVGWDVVARVKAGAAGGHIPIRVPRSGPEAALIVPLKEAGVQVIEVSTAEIAAATGQLIDAVANRTLAHIGQPPLDKAIAGAALHISAEGASTWSQRQSAIEITPLRAVTVALGGVPAPAEKKRSGVVW